MIRWSLPKDAGKLVPFVPEFFITDDSRRIRYYNCLGFALGRQNIFKPEQYQNRIPDLLLQLQYTENSEGLSAAENGLALFNGVTTDWHVAKHLRGAWYESKFYTGLRVVHQLKDLKTNYGEPSFWVINDSETGRRARSKFVQDVYGKPLEKWKQIADSVQELAFQDSGGSDDVEDYRFLMELTELANRRTRYRHSENPPSRYLLNSSDAITPV